MFVKYMCMKHAQTSSNMISILCIANSVLAFALQLASTCELPKSFTYTRKTFVRDIHVSYENVPPCTTNLENFNVKLFSWQQFCKKLKTRIISYNNLLKQEMLTTVMKCQLDIVKNYVHVEGFYEEAHCDHGNVAPSVLQA